LSLVGRSRVNVVRHGERHAVARRRKIADDGACRLV